MINQIALEVNGNTYTNLKSYSITKQIEALSGSFVIESSVTDQLGNFPFKIQEPIKVTIDGEAIITGYIDKQEIDYSPTSHNIRIVGRDKTADLIDSTLDAKQFNPPISLQELIKKVCQLVGYEIVSINKLIGLKPNANQISVINNYGSVALFTTSDKIQLQNSESGFNLIRKFAEKRHVIVNSDGEGNIVLAKIGEEKAKTILQNIKQSDLSITSSGNNIKNARVSYDWEGRFNKYTVKSMILNGSQNIATPNTANQDIFVQATSSPQVGIAYDDEVRNTRKLTLIGSTAMTSSDCQDRAKWEANLRIMKSLTYSCEVTGFRQNLNEIQSSGFASNPLWKPNQLVYVVDEYAGIDDEMLIKSVNYTQDLNGGSVTKLELVNKLAFSLSLFEPALRIKKGAKSAGAMLFQ